MPAALAARTALLFLAVPSVAFEATDVCSACDDVWLKINPPTAPPLNTLETSDAVEDGCKALGVANDPDDENYLIRVALSNQTSCPNYQTISRCFAAINRTCEGCDKLGLTFENTSELAREYNLKFATGCARDSNVNPQICRGHSALTVEDMSFARWQDLIYWRIDHCEARPIEAPPSRVSGPAAPPPSLAEAWPPLPP